jgi:ferredoxin
VWLRGDIETGIDRPGITELLEPSTAVFFTHPQPRNPMPHIVTDKCNGCKFTDCVEVCPVACFYELDNQVVIHPEECIDCMACVDVCPVHAIYEEQDLPPEFAKDVEFNAVQSRQIKDSGMEAITVRKEPLPSAAERKKALGY